MLVLINVLWTLTVTVTGIEKAKGELVVAVYDSEENFMDGHKLYSYRYIEVKKSGQLSFDYGGTGRSICYLPYIMTETAIRN